MNKKNARPSLKKMADQGGFTLIELVMVIVILGVLSAIALPKFVSISDDARTASAKATAGAISSASAINFAGRMSSAANGTPTNAVPVNTANACDLTLINKMMSSPVDVSQYTIAPLGGAQAGADGNCAAGSNTNGWVALCTLTDNNLATATAQVSIACAK
ncbi:prepilin-type N-terminal cleavage/methylation domain-containing protein [Duganella sp. PWIR1]